MSALLRLALIAVVAVSISACAFTAPRRTTIPVALADMATIEPGVSLRYWGDDPDFASSHARTRPGKDGRLDFLTLSGGGINGAYGAGYLVGWSKTGNRPQFEVVTGISVGAMMAPLAFLGSAYDGRLEAVFSSLTESGNPAADFLSALFGAPSILSNDPVVAAIAYIVDDFVLDEIAKAHRDGRRLYIGTTNLDAQRPVIWDIGAIANSNLPNRLALVREIILASAAVPGIFPPVLIDVNAAGHAFDELHVDGGVTQQVLLMPGGFGPIAARARLYVIFNGVVDPTRETVQISSISLLERTVPTMLKYLGRGNLAQLANAARSSGIAFWITAIPNDFPQSRSVFGSPQWLAALFEYGYENGLADIWQQKR